MARATFGGTAADTVARRVKVLGHDVDDYDAATLTVWSAKIGGTQYTDLLVNGAASNSVPVDSTGQVPEFQGPDGVTVVWVSAGGARVKMLPAEGPTDTSVAGYVNDSASSTRAAVLSTIESTAATGFFNVLSYGADNTGATDAGPAINSAIADAKVAGGVVFLPPGTYLINTTINLSNIHPAFDPSTGVGVTLKGAGHNATKLTGGETGYGFIELVGSNRVTVEGMSLTGSGTLQYGIIGGRTTGDASSGEHTFRDVVVYGAFSIAAIFMLSSEVGTYENSTFYTTSGKAMVLARDNRGWSATAKYTPLSSTSIISAGNGIQYLRKVNLETIRVNTGDSPLTIEFVQSFLAESVYMTSSGAPLVVIQKGCHEATFRACHQEWNQSITGATEPFGFYCANVVTGTEESAVRLSIEGSSVYTVYSEDNVRFVDFVFRGGRWLGTQAFQFDVSLCTNANISYDPAAANIAGVATPRYRFRGGGWENQVTPARMSTTTRNTYTWDLGEGRYVWDTTLNKPIWRGPSGWVDATGAAV